MTNRKPPRGSSGTGNPAPTGTMDPTLEHGSKSPSGDGISTATLQSDFSQSELGERLRAARRLGRMTLQDLSRASGYSITHLSQVERGHACPTVGALDRIARALGRDVRAFLEPRDLPDVSIVRREGRQQVGVAGNGTRSELAAGHIPGGELQAVVCTLPPASNGDVQGQPAGHSRIFYILSGRLEFTVEAGPLVCESGAAIYVAPNAPLRFRNPAGESCEMVILTRPGS
jgi:transcriptional regulator with XRE-family HTH domain